MISYYKHSLYWRLKINKISFYHYILIIRDEYLIIIYSCRWYIYKVSFHYLLKCPSLTKSLILFIFFGFSCLSRAFLLFSSFLSIVFCSFKALILMWYLIFVKQWMTSLLMSGHIFLMARTVVIMGSSIFSSLSFAPLPWILLKALFMYWTWEISSFEAPLSPPWLCRPVQPVGLTPG